MLKLRGSHVRTLIEQGGDSVRSFSVKHNIPQSTLQAWILGRRNIKLNQLQMLASVLHVDVLDIYDVVPSNRKLNQLDSDIKTIRELFLTMTDEQRTKTISVALALLDGSEVE